MAGVPAAARADAAALGSLRVALGFLPANQSLSSFRKTTPKTTSATMKAAVPRKWAPLRADGGSVMAMLLSNPGSECARAHDRAPRGAHRRRRARLGNRARHAAGFARRRPPKRTDFVTSKSRRARHRSVAAPRARAAS